MCGKYTLVFLAVLVPGLALGQTSSAYQCSLDDMQRRIEIFTEPGVTVPCEVHYYKDTEAPGDNQVLWRATTEAGFCEAKAEEFAEQLREWGWDCVRGGEEEPEPATDDTAALEPAN